MQSLFRRAWCHDQGDSKPEKALLSNPIIRPSPLVDVSPLFKMKRKRSSSPENTLMTSRETLKKRKMGESERPWQSQLGNGLSHVHTKIEHMPENESNPQPYPFTLESLAQSTPSIPDPPASKIDDVARVEAECASIPEPESSSIDEAKQTELRQIIDHQFNLEILLKHRELRLIEQELAKCQIALEQLRRCELVPYPGSTGLSEAISNGSGPSIKAQSGFTQPRAPAPWGVADGPYTRHYSRWLLNDATFDSMPVNQVQSQVDYFSAAPEGRSTRNSGAGLGRAGKSRPSRDSVGNFSHALPNYPVQTRGKGGPLVIKRVADNKFVKLICNNCQRGDFSSVQGFLNHCRIAHKVDYKSHEAAATDCGRPLEDDETHLIPQATPSAAPAARTPGPKAVSVPSVQPAPVAFVHPLNAPVMPRYTWKVQAAAAARAEAEAAADKAHLSPRPSSVETDCKNKALTPAARSFHAEPLVTSSTMPYLSTRFAKHGLGGDLQQVANRAREKVDLGPELADDEDSSIDLSQKPSASQAGDGTAGMRFATNVASPGLGSSQGRKGQYSSASRPRPAPLESPHPSHTGMGRGETASEIPESPQDSNVSPHTADSNPGLVSDHEDDDGVSDLDEARSERHVSPDEPITQLGGMRRGIGACGDAMDLDVEVEDDADGHHEVLIRPRGLAYQEFTQRSNGSTSARPVSRFGEAAK